MATGERIALERLLTRVAEFGASDLHMTVGAQPVLRVGGKLQAIDGEEIVTPDRVQAYLKQLFSEDEQLHFEKMHSAMAMYALGNKARFKVTAFSQKGMPSITLHFVNPKLPLLDELGLPTVVTTFSKFLKGLVLVAGPLGSGCTTTLAALVEDINRERTEHIVTIEQPIELLFVNEKSIVEQREVGKDTPSFAAGIADAIAEDVNVVMLSNLETADAIMAALDLAESGRLVLAGMHTENVVKTIERIMSSVPPDRQEQTRLQLAAALQGIVAQKLLPRVGGGTVLIAEVLTLTPPIRTILRDGVIYQLQTMLQTSREDGMVPFDRMLAVHVQSGEIALEEALQNATDPSTINALVGMSLSS